MTRKRFLGYAAPMALVALASCTTTTTAADHPATGQTTADHRIADRPEIQARPIRCPEKEPTPTRERPALTAATLLKPRPVIAVICQYNARISSSNVGAVTRIVLTGPAAYGLAAVIDGLSPVPVSPIGCPPSLSRYSQLIEFGYLSGPAESAIVTYPGCPVQAVVSVGARSLAFDGPIAPSRGSPARGYGSSSRPSTTSA